MVLSEFLKESGFYGWVSARLGGSRLTAGGLLGALAVVAGGLSALLVNDTVCLMLTPFVLTMAARARLAPLPFLMALATSANIGSALTLTGNPQNMIVGTMSGIGYARFAAATALPVAAALAANYALLRWHYRKDLTAPPFRGVAEPVAVDRALLTKSLACLALVTVGFAATPWTGVNMAWTALAAAVLLLTIGGKDPYKVFAGVDWTLLLFFAGLFVVVGGLERSGFLQRLEEDFVKPIVGESVARQNLHLTWLTVAGCQIFSNVPFVLVAGHVVPSFTEPDLSWILLAFVSTVAGNLTILGSVANVIVVEQARNHVKITFWQYLQFGALTTLASTALGVSILFLEHRLGWL
jgi:Na+/H+ antiporter NhaD/arsenite permease-like protein